VMSIHRRAKQHGCREFDFPVVRFRISTIRNRLSVRARDRPSIADHGTGDPTRPLLSLPVPTHRHPPVPTKPLSRPRKPFDATRFRRSSHPHGNPTLLRHQIVLHPSYIIFEHRVGERVEASSFSAPRHASRQCSHASQRTTADRTPTFASQFCFRAPFGKRRL